MNNYIKDINKKKDPEYILEHIKVFGKEPYIIGMFWSEPEELIKNIEKAIKDNKPYDEYELLTDDEKKAFDEGELLF